MADEDAKPAGKGKLIIIIAIVSILVLGSGGAAAYFLLFAEEPVAESVTKEGEEAVDTDAQEVIEELIDTSLAAMYVGMPRPFVFNVPGQTRERLVQIKVQLMVRGTENDALARLHIPLIEGTLLQVFSATNAEDIATGAGKEALKLTATKEVQSRLMDVTEQRVIERVLFTGFVMQ